MKDILVLFGGESAEHEVSVISGLQVLEKIDRTRYRPHVVYIAKSGEAFLVNTQGRKDFLIGRRKRVSFGKNAKGGYIRMEGILQKRIYPACAYLAFHGGSGEGGVFQGLLEACGIPFTSPAQEGAVIAMNKQLTKEAVAREGVPTVPGESVFSADILTGSRARATALVGRIGLPVIVKPVHLGSSIAITVARSEIELEKALLEAAHVDTEVLVEKFLSNFKEYNCAVRIASGSIEVSEVERPVSKDEFLSFADKYQRGSKKTGGEGGMASLDREIPANIPSELKQDIQETAKKAFAACRLKGMVRIDFMLSNEGTLYLTEINPIPGSLAFYLWEASGISFTQQISDAIEQAIVDEAARRGRALEYETDIVQKFVQRS